MFRCIGSALFLVCVAFLVGETQAGVIVAGTDTAPASHSAFTINVGGSSETINLTSGPFDIKREQQTGDGSGGPGDTIDTEIVSLSLFGTSVNLGNLTIRVGNGAGVQESGTFGQVTNVVSAPPGSTVLVGPDAFISGDSFFDVFFEIDTVLGTFYNRTPHRLEATGITQLPPFGAIHFPPAEVDIFLRVGATNSVINDPFVGTVGGTHTVTPEPGTFVIWSSFLVLGATCRRRKR